jgi:hypothetical protein
MTAFDTAAQWHAGPCIAATYRVNLAYSARASGGAYTTAAIGLAAGLPAAVRLTRGARRTKMVLHARGGHGVSGIAGLSAGARAAFLVQIHSATTTIRDYAASSLLDAIYQNITQREVGEAALSSDAPGAHYRARATRNSTTAEI